MPDDIIDRNKTDLTMMTSDMLRDIAKKQDEIILEKLHAYCDDCSGIFPIKELYLEEPPLEVMEEYKKQGEDIVFQIRQKCVKLICQSYREKI